MAGALLYLLPLPLLPASLTALFAGQSASAIGYAFAFALTMLGATMIRRGLVVAAEAAQRSILRRTSTVPYKLIGALLVSAAMAVVALFNGYNILEAVLFAASVLIGCYLYYGFDRNKANADAPMVGITSEEVIELLDEAEQKIAAIDAARPSIRNTEFRDRLRRISAEARKILAIIEADPRDARRARKFLKVYLDGAQQVTEGYAALHGSEEAPELEDNFRRVLGTIESVIAEQQDKLRQNNLSELDVQIEVLQMQLEKEGVT